MPGHEVTGSPASAIQFRNAVPTVDEVREECKRVFNLRACRWQAQFTQAILARRGDVVLKVATGMGKTLAFWLPLLFRPTGIQLVVTALNMLGKQYVESLQAVGIQALAIDSTLDFEVTREAFEAIASGEIRVVIISPEQLMREEGHFTRLFKRLTRSAKDFPVISVIFDEAHCIALWGTFRHEYKEVVRLRYRLPKDVPFALVSATLPRLIRHELSETLHLERAKLTEIARSTDRPNVYICVRRIKYAVDSFKDLAFIIPKTGRPPKFIVFCHSIKKCMGAAQYLWSLIGKENQPEKKVVWFHANMSEDYKRSQIEKLRVGELWGICATDAFGMGMDIPDIILVVNYEVQETTMSQVWQRFGRAARDRSLQGCAVLLVEGKFFDDARAKAEQQRQARLEKAKRKREERDEGNAPRKRVARENRVPQPRQDDPIQDSDSEEEEPDEEGEDAAQNSDQELRAAYRQNNSTKRNKKEAWNVEPALDDLINAATRPKVRCRRKSIKAFFDSDKPVDDHLICDPAGCARCGPIPLALCCDLCCTPQNDLFAQLFPLIATEDVQRAPARSGLRKYQRGAMEEELLKELHGWRKRKAAELYGRGVVDLYGAGIFFPTTALDRVIDCVHYNKISSLEDLQHEVKWVDMGQYGAEILAIIQRIRPRIIDSPLTTRPLENRVLNGAAPVPAPKAIRRCGFCGEAGHDRRKCTKKPPQAAGSQNIPPGTVSNSGAVPVPTVVPHQPPSTPSQSYGAPAPPSAPSTAFASNPATPTMQPPALTLPTTAQPMDRAPVRSGNPLDTLFADRPTVRRVMRPEDLVAELRERARLAAQPPTVA